MLKLLTALLGGYNEKVVRRLTQQVEVINGLEPRMKLLRDDQLAHMTEEFRGRLAKGETLEDLLPEAFAVVREAAWRVLGQRHFDVQLIGGMVLHEGNIAEMKTGEGKTLVATLPAYLNALTGKGVHVITVNDYLAKFHSEWMGRVYRFLGLSVGLVIHGVDSEQRRAAYRADITYGTNNEFGFDYLRDNMASQREELSQRPLNYAIVDEVDSILIDEARTPLIISGDAGKSTDLYQTFARVAERLILEEDYTIDEKLKTAAPTEVGVAKVEKMLNVPHLYESEGTDYSHHLNSALKAKALYHRDREYVIKDGQVIIVDEFTGRLMYGRRWSDGLHQAVEAKEGVHIERETVTLATITIQNYFRMYNKLSGMTGTAATEEEEFRKIYGMDVIVIPTNKPMVREDLADVVYKTENAKFRAVVDDIGESRKKGQPVLVGTISITKSEHLSDMLTKRGVPHQVLNAKHHEKEAEIIAQAGRYGAVTIATNMAGRGTDILLGGNPEFLVRERLRARGFSPEAISLAMDWVRGGSAAAGAEALAPGHLSAAAGGAEGEGLSLEEEAARALEAYHDLWPRTKAECDTEHEQVVAAGGLHIIGTERHESRRIDNQLRGRAGRQGDPGMSRFYVALEDDLMRLFGGDNVSAIMDRLGIEEDMPIDAKIISRAIENAQKKVEARNFDSRKHVLEYDDVMNKQREVIYNQRRKVLEGESLRDVIFDMTADVTDGLLDLTCHAAVHPEEWNYQGLIDQTEQLYLPVGKLKPDDLEGMGRDAIRELLLDEARSQYEQKEAKIGSDTMRILERIVMLRAVDERWIDHLTAMDDLREGVGLRAYGNRDPLVEYKHEAFEMFHSMIEAIKELTVSMIYHLNISREPERRQMYESGGGEEERVKEPVRTGKKVGRNDPCPCGSGKKYKKCHGRDAS
ncbi:MAG: preprotein translocase subunit SecA [Symbiobacteriia bacterium]